MTGQEWLLAIAGFAATVLGAGGLSVLVKDWLAHRREVSKYAGERETIRSKDYKEWRSERYEQMNARITDLETKHEECMHDKAQILTEVGELRGELKATRRIVDSLEHHNPVAYIVCDESQTITEWNLGASELLRWSAAEAIGKKVSMLVPARLRGKHEAAFHSASVEKRSPNDETAARLRESFANDKNGTEIPVQIILSGWELDGKRMYSAEIRRR